MSKEQTCQCGQSHGACATEFQYAVKIVCGTMTLGQPPVVTPVAPGRYWTAINIHNPTKCEEAHFRWKVVVNKPIGGDPGVISEYQRTQTLGPDSGIEIDSSNIMQALSPSAPTFVKGYVVVESDIELDVVAVYSGTQGANAPLNSFHTERVSSRCVPVCEDLILPLHTGIADWRTVPPTATPGPLGPVVQVFAPWGVPASFPSKWVGQNSTDGQGTTVAGLRYYELCFDLCYGFQKPVGFQIQLIVDDTAQLFLVNSGGTTLLANVPPYNNAPINISGLPFRAGRNCFRVVVNNVGGSTGFALAGILHVIRGKCPCSTLPMAARTTAGQPTPDPQDDLLSTKTVVKKAKNRKQRAKG